MVDLKINEGFIRLQEKNLEQMMTDNPDTRKAIQEKIREVLWEARNKTAHDIERKIGNNGQSARALRNIVFQKVLGGNINILNKKRGTANWRVVQKTRKVEQNPHMRGGNRRRRTMRTVMLQGYEPTARGFILRFQNSGTKQRFIGGRNTMRNYYDKVRNGTGNRGQITAGNFFVSIASRYLGEGAEKLSKMIEEEIAKITNNNNNT